MKIIDEKGKLFAKINVIDFLVILFLFCLVPMFYFAYKILILKPVVLKREFVEVERDCQLVKLEPEVLKLISVGDKELDENGQVIGEIISLGQSKPYEYKLDVGGQKVVKAAPILKQIEAKLKLIIEIKENRPYYKNEVIQLGSPFEFKVNNFILTAIPFRTEKWISLRVKFSQVIPEIAEFVQKGDIEKDAFEKTIARIGSVISNKPARVITVTDAGKFITLSHPFNRDIMASLDVLCVEKEGAYYFKDSLVKMGNNFAITTDSYSLSGLIIGIEVK